MRSVLSLSLVLCVAGAVGAVGCSTSGEDTGTDEARATADELTLAHDAVDLIAGKNAHCNQCHTAGRADVKRWGEAMLNVASECLSSTSTMTTAERAACLSDDKNNPASSYSATKLGLLAAGANRLQGFFNAADPTGARFQAFKNASMPMGDTVPALTSDEFTKVMNWVFAGMPAFNDVMGGPPEPADCVQSITPELKAHVTQMKAEGWGARLTDATTPMFGCGSSTDPLTCLAQQPDAPPNWAAPNVAQKLRVLRELPKTNYWVRSSADGRFVGYGQNTAAGIVDLASANDAPPIAVDARYDPSFFPNNDGVSFAGTGTQKEAIGPIRVCRQSVLGNLSSQGQPHLTLKEAGCTEIANAVYQSVGAALDGSLFWMSMGAHVNDDGGNFIQAPLEGFEQESPTFLVPMVSDGVGYQAQKGVQVNTPLEGDQMLSPSSRVMVTRSGSKPATRGYTLRRLNTTKAPDTAKGPGEIGVTTDVVGRLCGGGGKAMVSFDERFVVTHEYADPAEGTGLPEKSSNVVLWDLVTGDKVRITNMPANQYALYPHFRADGWLYFLVRDMSTPDGKHTLVATDVALKRLHP